MQANVVYIPEGHGLRARFRITRLGSVNDFRCVEQAIVFLKGHGDCDITLGGIDWLGPEAVFANMRKLETDGITTLRSAAN